MKLCWNIYHFKVTISIHLTYFATFAYKSILTLLSYTSLMCRFSNLRGLDNFEIFGEQYLPKSIFGRKYSG